MRHVLPAFAAAAVAGDLLLQAQAQLPPAWALCAPLPAAALACIGAAWARRRPGARGPAPWLAALALGAAVGWGGAGGRASLAMAEELPWELEGRTLRVVGVVASLPGEADGASRFTFAVEQVLDPAPQTGVRIPGRVALSWYQPSVAVRPAQRWALSVRLHRPQATFNPGGFDAEAWMLEQGVRAQGSVRTGRQDPAPQLLDERSARWDANVDRLRAQLRGELQQVLQARPYAAVIVALVMGDQGPIRDEDWALFNRTGISHLVSISGLHITMIAAAVAWLATALWRRSAWLLARAQVPTVRAVAAILGGLAYCLLAGWGVPAQRTLLMLAVVALAQCLRVRLAAADVLAAAAILVVAWDPWAVLVAGFWLSFGAVACIFLAAGGRSAGDAGWRARLREGVRLQAAISIGQVPLTLAIFGQVSLVAPLANALAIPLVSYLVAPAALCGAALVHAGGLAAPAGAFLLEAAQRLFAALAAYLQALVQAPWAWWSLPLPPLASVVCACAGCAWMLAPAGWPGRALGATALLPMLLWPVDRPGAGALWVTALDVGQGMCLVLETAHDVVVFDTGPRYGADSDAGGRVLVPYLRGPGIGKVDLLVVSHPDADHAGGAAALLRELPVRAVWTSVAPAHPLLPAALTAQATRRTCVAGQTWQLGDLYLQMLSPDADLLAAPRASTNARSCVVLASLGSRRVLLTGDVPARQEGELVARAGQTLAAAPVDLMVAPHHGSHSSSSPALLAAARPRWVSMQLGYRNHFGHPHPEVVARYLAAGARVVRSDESGAAQWRLDGDGRLRLRRWRIDAARYWHNRPGQVASAAAAAGDALLQ